WGHSPLEPAAPPGPPSPRATGSRCDDGTQPASSSATIASATTLEITRTRRLRAARRPRRLVVAEGHRRTRPARRRLGPAQPRRQMPEAADRRVARHRPALELRGREPLRDVLELGLRDLSAPDEPAPGLRERDPHEPAAALAGAARERDHRAER